MEETISLKELFATLRKRLKLIVIITIVAGLLSGIYSYFILTPMYQVSTQLLVNQKKAENAASFNAGEIQTNLQLINTYNVIIKSPAILDIVASELDMSTGQLNAKISVSSQEDSQVINLVVQDTDPQRAATIANTTAEVFQQQIPQIMNADNVKILAKAVATENMGPVSPQPLLNIMIALVVGLILSVGLAFLLEYIDNTIKTEKDVEKRLELPLLGVITNMDKEGQKKKRPKYNVTVKGETYNV